MPVPETKKPSESRYGDTKACPGDQETVRIVLQGRENLSLNP